MIEVEDFFWLLLYGLIFVRLGIVSDQWLHFLCLALPALVALSVVLTQSDTKLLWR